MIRRRSLIAMFFVSPALAGCGTLKKFTGQRDDTVLPGSREEIIPEDQQRNQRPSSGKSDVPCDPAVDVDCAPTEPQDTIATEDLQ